MQFFSSKGKKDLKLSSSTTENESDGNKTNRNSVAEELRLSTSPRESFLCQSSDSHSTEDLGARIDELTVKEKKEKDEMLAPESPTAVSTSPLSASTILTTSQIDRVKTQLVEEFRCPISHMIMRDPVFTSDGETYEREEIERWLKVNQSSPATNVRLSDKVLKPNIALKKAINTFIEQNPEYLDEVYFSRSLELSFVEACKTSGIDSAKETEHNREIKSLVQQEKRIMSHRFDSNGTVLHIAAQYSSVGTFKAILQLWKENHKDQSLRDALLERDKDSWTALHLASMINTDYEVSREIIRRISKSGNTESIVALPVTKRSIKEVEGVLDNHFLHSIREEEYDNMIIYHTLGANIEARDTVSKYKGGSAMHIVCSKGSTKFLDYLLRHNASISARTGTHPADFSSVHFAARGGHSDILSMLVSSGADIDLKCNPNGCKDWTALHLAARNGRVSAVESLIRLGANVNSPAEEDRMGLGTFGPAYLATFYGHEDCVAKLIDAGAHIDGSSEEHNLLQAAVKNNQLHMVKMLLDRGANINAADGYTKQTALHIAASNGYVAIVKLLLNYQLDNKMDELDKLENEEKIKKFIDINAEDKKGNTPLHEAAIHGNKEIITILICNGANWKSKNSSGKTAAEEAIKSNRREIAEELLHDVKRVKSSRISQQRPIQAKLLHQEKLIKEQSEMLKKQEIELKKNSETIDELKAQIIALQNAVFKNL